LSRSTVTALAVIVDVKPTPPSTLNVSPPSILVALPVSPARSKNVEIAMLLAAVTRPFESTVNCGI